MIATRPNLEAQAEAAQVIHLATHGEFRPDAPLFSTLYLSDGPLTATDVFNLELSASLVTLSACQSGTSAVGGGDELVGFSRAFLYTGAASLLMSLWRVEDQATAHLMDRFYQDLLDGQRKPAALRQAQKYGFSTVRWSGTSFATPQISGLAALLWSTGRVPFYQIKQHVWRTAHLPRHWNGVREIDCMRAFRAIRGAAQETLGETEKGTPSGVPFY